MVTTMKHPKLHHLLAITIVAFTTLIATVSIAAPDPLDIVNQVIHGRGGDPDPVPPHCVYDENEPHVLLVYARPIDAPDTYQDSIALIRAQANQSNGILVAGTREMGWDYRVKVLCGLDGLAIVREAVLPTPGTNDNMTTIRADLAALGMRSGPAKLMLNYNGQVGNYGGQGTWSNDDRPGPENANNQGGAVSVVYTTTRLTGWLWLHELFHSMGAVQDSAPHSTGKWHCNDAPDVMCEQDDGPRSNYDVVCGAPRKIDCNRDDYFDPEPAPGSYLATHWNLASVNNSYLWREKLTADQPTIVPTVPSLPLGGR